MPNQAPWLRLPYKVRRQIYVELNIIGYYPGPIDLSRDRPVGQWSSRDQRFIEDDGTIHPWPVFVNQLFYVSRAVSEDARTVFYSENKISLFHDYGHGLQSLMNMGPLGWKSLRSLSVILGTTCRWDRPWHDTPRALHEKDSQLSNDTGVLRDWLYICDMLASYIKHDDQLELFLTCDAATKETAAAFLDPMRNLPRLTGCSIRLGPGWDPDLQQMIMTTVREKTSYPAQPSTTFPFFDLPLELQHRILEYSDLVAPTPSLLYSLCRSNFINRQCWMLECNAYPCRYAPYVGDYCPSQHAAFSTVHPCWQTPDMLFLVSKTMRQLAIPIFYSKNILEVRYFLGDSPGATTWSAQKSGFLRYFPKYSFPHLRHIHLKLLSDMNYSRVFRPNTKELEDWIISLNLLSFLAAPGKLTLEIDLTYAKQDLLDYESLDNEDWVAAEWAYYDRVLEPMTVLTGVLKDLFIHLRCPAHPSLEEKRVGKEMSLERSVMGSDYDSFARGKKPTQYVDYA